jgi:putative hydrolase of the HAD superfamily
MRTRIAGFDWTEIGLVIFDVDGTLYRQRALRWRIGAELLADGLIRARLDTIRALSIYRKTRETLSQRSVEPFEETLIAMTAEKTGLAGSEIRMLVNEWIADRPLRHLRECRYPGLPELFAGLRRHGKVVAILSDYPAIAKLSVLELEADHVLAADDPAVGLPKPHPRGIEVLTARSGIAPSNTLMIGDRPERDGMAARSAGAHTMIRSQRSQKGWATFSHYREEVFAPLLSQ